MRENLIKRSDAIAIIEKRKAKIVSDCESDKWFRKMISEVEAIPSADRPSGTYTNSNYNVEWYAIEATCNLCGERWMGNRNFCPNCGAKMK